METEKWVGCRGKMHGLLRYSKTDVTRNLSKPLFTLLWVWVRAVPSLRSRSQALLAELEQLPKQQLTTTVRSAPLPPWHRAYQIPHNRGRPHSQREPWLGHRSRCLRPWVRGKMTARPAWCCCATPREQAQRQLRRRRSCSSRRSHRSRLTAAGEGTDEMDQGEEVKPRRVGAKIQAS